jgi:hypothetical protein
MWSANLFATFDLLGLPAAIRGGIQPIVSRVAQTFLQLVVLSIIMVGQNVQTRAAVKRAEDTYKDAEAVLHEAGQIQTHLEAHDAVLETLAAKLAPRAPATTEEERIRASMRPPSDRAAQ